MYSYSKNLGVNFLRRWEFECKFDRDPKTWSFKELHDLYLRAKERADRRRKEFSDFIDMIINEVEPNEKGERHVYLERENGTYMYCIRKDENFGWSYSTNYVTFSKDVVTAREEKIDFILTNQRKFELGEKLRKLDKMKSSFDRHVFGIIEEAMDEELRKRYKKVKNHYVPKVIKVNLGGTVYYAALDKDSRNSGYDWKRFEILGQEQSDIIEL
jgi:hypothetical protein